MVLQPHIVFKTLRPETGMKPTYCRSRCFDLRRQLFDSHIDLSPQAHYLKENKIGTLPKDVLGKAPETVFFCGIFVNVP